MLDVYMDYNMTLAFVRAVEKTNRVKDLSQRSRLIKAESFIKQACNLKIDKNIKHYCSHILASFNQGVGEKGKPSYVDIEKNIIMENKSAVALLDKKNPLFPDVSNCNLTITGENLIENLALLMFSAPEQVVLFEIIPSGIQPREKTEDSPNVFKGWNTLIKHPLVPMTDAIIIDPYFLEPASHDNDIKSYVDYSLLPLFKVLNQYALNRKLTINIFTEYKKQNSREESHKFAGELFEQLESSIKINELDIKLLMVLNKSLNQHKRILYTNYFSLRTELSFHHFRSDDVTGKKKDEVNIKPFAVDNPNTDPHSIMIDDLADLHLLTQKPDTKFFGKKSNLSPMIIRAL
ncbi:MAG TPA: hypothetical protein PKE03_12535 [Bacteroidales bacterium]|nr:hypothetical protein [Bacteroidales bacterium]